MSCQQKESRRNEGGHREGSDLFCVCVWGGGDHALLSLIH